MRIYSHLRVIWLATLVSALTVFTLLPESQIAALVGTAVNLLAYGFILYHLHKLSGESLRFARAFLFQVASLILQVLALVGLAMYLANSSDTPLFFASMAMMTGGIFGLVSDYNLFWGLDERIIPCGYAYPARRIRWCFYAPLLGAAVAAMLEYGAMAYEKESLLLAVASVIIQLVFQAAALVLFLQYNRAVRDREEHPLDIPQ